MERKEKQSEFGLRAQRTRRARHSVKRPLTVPTLHVDGYAEIAGDVRAGELRGDGIGAIAIGRGGLREQNKREKLTRIIAAGRELFGRNGFEATTMRRVAVQARIGVGTLFLYARTKEDLLALVFVKELRSVIDKGFQNLPDGDLQSRLLFSFQPTIEHHARNMVLSRSFVHHVAWVGEPHAPTIGELVRRWLQKLTALVDTAKAQGEIRADIDSRLLAECSQMFFLSYLRSWISGHITRSALDAGLEASLRLLLTGLGAKDGGDPQGRGHS